MPKKEKNLFFTYSKLKTLFLTVLLLFLIVFPRFLPVRIKLPTKNFLGWVIIIIWLAAVILQALYFIFRKFNVKYRLVKYLDIALDVALVSSLLAFYSNINGPYFFVLIFVIFGAAFYLDLHLIIAAGSFSGFALIVGFIAENNIYLGKDYFDLTIHLLFIASITYFIYLFSLSFVEIRREKEQIKKTSEINKSLLLTVAHQLRYPMPTIRDNLQLIISGKLGKISNKQKKFLSLSFDLIREMLEKANNVIYYYQIKTGELYLKKRKINIKDLIKSVAANYKEEVKFFSQIKKTEISADKDKLAIVLRSLIENAFAYSSRNKRAIVKLKKAKYSDYVLIEILDFGIGIPREFMPDLFKAHKRAKNARKLIKESPGIDLYVAKKIINMHHGSIEVKSKENQGTTFYITLPTKDTKWVDK